MPSALGRIRVRPAIFWFVGFILGLVVGYFIGAAICTALAGRRSDAHSQRWIFLGVGSRDWDSLSPLRIRLIIHLLNIPPASRQLMVSGATIKLRLDKGDWK